MTTTLTRKQLDGVITAPLRAEHADLLPAIDAFRETADAIGQVGDGELLRQLTAAQFFLRDHLIVHAKAEDAAMYPVVESFIGRGATATMSRDHVEVMRMTDQLAEATTRLGREGLFEEVARDLRRLLYGLHAVVRLHFAKEEEVYLPLLDAKLTPEAADDLFGALHHAVHG